MDSKGDLIEPIKNLAAIKDRLLLIEPNPDAAFALNPLDVSQSNVTQAVGLIEYIMAGLLDAKFTALQSTLFRNVVPAIIEAIPNPTLDTFKEVMVGGCPISKSLTRMRGSFSRAARQDLIPRRTTAPAKRSYGGSTIGGQVVMTQGVNELPLDTKARALLAVQSFDKFTSDNDPHGEHDFGSFEIEGETYFFKIDYYALDMDGGSEDPADPEKTTRVLTIMRADEY